MGLIGDLLTGLTTNQIVVGLIAFIMLVGSAGLGAYREAQKEGEVLCLGCLALNPYSELFDGDWWINYPSSFEKAGQAVEHPSWVKSALGEYEVVMIFMWQDPCPSCEEQWENMKDDGIVDGSEASASMAKYTQNVKLYSLDIRSKKGDEAFDTYARAKTTQGTPTTTFVIKMSSGKYGWYSYIGPMGGDDVDMVLQIAMHH